MTARCRTLAAGLINTRSHTAAKGAEDSLAIVSRMGITEKDLYRACNDTTNAALATGRILTGGAHRDMRYAHD